MTPTKSKTSKKVFIPTAIRVKDLARLLNLPVTRVMRELIRNDVYTTINEGIDPETAAVIAEDLGYRVEIGEGKEITKKKEVSKSEDLKEVKLLPRPPVVVVLGHVDHGKTTLLDYIRKTDVARYESGGITQSIGAYQIDYKGKPITFIDTPGHEAFERMRERGAHLTDIAILVIAADDGVKPQTREAVRHIKKSGIPMIVAINKIDKPQANPKGIKNELAAQGVQIEEWGGDVPVLEISAKTGKGVDALLDLILLVSDMEELCAPLTGSALGTVIESRLSPERGIEVTILVQSGIFRTGDEISSPQAKGKIRRMENDKGKEIKEAKPSTPVKIIGFSDPPAIGSLVQVGAEDEIDVSEQAAYKARIKIAERAKKPNVKRLNLIINADTHGSEEAILENIAKIKSERVVPLIIYCGVGGITESDVLKAHITGSKLIGFKVKVARVAKDLAKQLGVKVNSYDVIYKLIEDTKKGLEEMLEEEEEIIELGQLKVLAIFRTEKDNMIVGGKVTQGTVEKDSNIRVKREEKLIGEGKLVELQSGQQKAEAVKSGQEAGIKFRGGTRIKEGDILEFYKVERKKKML